MSFFALLTVGIAAAALDAAFYKRSTTVADVTKVSRLPGLALSVPYYESRVREYRDYSEVFYPAMHPINSMDFVYAR